MSDLKPLAPAVLVHIAQVLQVPMKGLVASIELLDEGGTVPFIARYRKEATGNLDEVQIRSIEEKLAYFRELQDRRATILASIEGQGKLTPELKARLEATLAKSELEDLYLPYKPKRRTKATIARDGEILEPGRLPPVSRPALVAGLRKIVPGQSKPKLGGCLLTEGAIGIRSTR